MPKVPPTNSMVQPAKSNSTTVKELHVAAGNASMRLRGMLGELELTRALDDLDDLVLGPVPAGATVVHLPVVPQDHEGSVAKMSSLLEDDGLDTATALASASAAARCSRRTSASSPTR